MDASTQMRYPGVKRKKTQSTDTQTDLPKHKAAQVSLWQLVTGDITPRQRADAERTRRFIEISKVRLIKKVGGKEQQAQEAEEGNKEEERRVTSEKGKREEKDYKKKEQREEPTKLEGKKGPRIQLRSLKTLEGQNWLDDEVINEYMALIADRESKKGKRIERVHCMNSFFYTRLQSGGYQAVKRWTKKNNLLSFAKVLVPVHLRNHWCLAVINVMNKTLSYYDSLGGQDEGCLTTLCKYLVEEAKEHERYFNAEEWALITKKKIPRQSNNHDCGVFVCLFAENEAAGRALNFTQGDIKKNRKRIAEAIMNGKLE
ncbi:sentrin-specific protease 1-like [Venturia canescens]|uniref:sentrin-specific protease 1-like n=1 Tax=Venturia canescens TaxID=32260 RepID=UPI001C9BF863|nr:sentrin-specific protease 1-like [Venturia canescens]